QGVPQNLTDELLTLSVDGTMAASGYGRAVLGNPVRSLLWLARRLDASGVGLRAGDIVLAGAVHAILPLGAGQTVVVSSPRLPEAGLGAGMLGIDLAERLAASDSLAVPLVAGREGSRGLRLAARMGYATSSQGIRAVLEAGVDVVFDASSADAHPAHWAELAS